MPKLDDNNYGVWSVRMMACLALKKVSKAISEDTVDPEDDLQARSLLVIQVKDHLLPFIKNEKTAKGMWLKLEELHKNKSRARLNLMRRELAQLKKEPKETVAKYTARAESLRDQLAAAGDTTSSADLISTVLNGLPKEFDTAVQILEAEDNSDLSDVLARLLIAEARMSRKDDRTRAEDHGSALAGHGGTPPSRPGQARPGQTTDKDKRTCYYCGNAGHIAKDCRKKKSDKASGKYTPKTQPGNNATVATAFTCSGGTAALTDEDLPPLIGEVTWMLDSGASHNITGDRDLLVNIRHLDTPLQFRFADGVGHRAEYAGDVFLESVNGEYVQLQNVHYVPASARNLISLSSVMRNGAQIEYWDDTRCIFAKNGVRIEAVCINGVYEVEGMVPEADMPVAPLFTDGTVCAAVETPELWHARFGHLGMTNLATLQAKQMVHGMKVEAEAFKDFKDPCEACVLSKQTRDPFPASKSAPVKGLLHVDLCGPITPASLGQSKYFLGVLEDHSKYSFVIMLKTKDQASAALHDLILMLQTQHGITVKIVRSDRGGEFCNGELAAFFASRGIVHQTTAPYSPESNGAAERLNRTLMEKVRALLLHSGAPFYLWAEGLQTANTLRNASPVSGRELTPHQLLTGSVPEVSHFKIFGCKAFAHVPKLKRRKLDAVSRPGVFIGYEANSKAYRILDPDGKTVRVARDVTFHEGVFPYNTPTPPAHMNDEPLCIVDIKLEPDEEPVSAPSGTSPAAPTTPTDEADSEDEDLPPLHMDTDSDEEDEDIAPLPTQDAPPPRRSSRLRQAPSEWWASSAAVVELQPEPVSVKEALAGPEAQQWKLAMDEEYAALLHNKTWEVEDRPPGTNVLPVKWIFKRKRDAAGNIERYKARLVVVGCRQREGLDYNEIYAPVGKHATLRTLLAVTAHRDLELHQLDVANAFLNGELEEDLWMQQPPGFAVGGSDRACHLRKTLYGLKQSPRAWYANLRSQLEAIGFNASVADPGLFIMMAGSGDWTYVLIHVDDILIAGLAEGVTLVKTKLAEVFKIKDMGESSFYLGMDIIRDRGMKTLLLTQKRYVADLMDKFASHAKSKKVPLSPATKLTKAGEPMDQTVVSYSEIIGSLMYLAVCTRPDLSQSVGALARYMANPTEDHLAAAKHVLAYISGTLDYGLFFGGSDLLELQGFADSDFAGDTDTRRSTTGYAFRLNGAVVSWQSRLQPTVAHSTTEAEYMAAGAAVKEALWFRKLLPEFGMVLGAVPIYGDNQAAIKLLKNPISCVRTKHIDVVHHFARERVARSEVTFTYISTEEMVADVLTKILPRCKFELCRLGLGVTNK